MEKITIKEILALAKILEENSKKYYDDLAEKVSSVTAKKFLKELSKEEEMHVAKIEEIEKKVTDGEGIPSSDSAVQLLNITNKEKISLGENPNIVEVLEFAISREKKAANTYSKLANIIEDKDAKNLFLFLHNEELNHIRKFENEYDDFTDEMSHDKVRELINKISKN